MQKLINLLKEQTQDLRVTYVEKSNVWASKEFARLSTLTEQEVKEEYGYYENKGNWPGWRHSKASHRRWATISNIKYNGEADYLEKAHKAAEAHYEVSIVKLADRIVKKGLDLDTISLKTESQMQKGNISTTITDGTKTVTAYTILAWGEVNAPHYRYLIK